MPEPGFTPERALARLRQLAREERAATAAGDWAALCRIAVLLPSTMAALQGVDLSGRPDGAAIAAEARAAHAAAVEHLQQHLDAVRKAIRRCASARRVNGVYVGRAPSPGRLDERR